MKVVNLTSGSDGNMTYVEDENIKILVDIGISCKEAEKRLAIYGKNKLEREKKQSFIKRFFRQFLNIMVAILLVSAVASITIALINKEYSELFEGFVILFIVIMNALIGVFQVVVIFYLSKNVLLHLYNQIH